MKNVHNQLPEFVKKKHEIIYSEYRADGITTFKVKNGNWGAISNTTKLIVPPIYDSIYYDHRHCFFKAVNFEEPKDTPGSIYHFFDQEGRQQAVFDEMDYIRTDDYGHHFYRVHNAKLWGLISPNYDILLEPQYEALESVSEHLLKAKLHEKWGIITHQGQVVMDFQAKEIFGSFEHATIVAHLDGGYHQIDNQGQVLNKLPFTFLLPPKSNSYWWRYEQNKHHLKGIVEGTRKAEADSYYSFDDFSEYQGKWGIVHESGEIVVEPTYDFIDFLGLSNYFKVFKGDLIFSDDDQLGTVVTGGRCGIINHLNEVIVPIRYAWIDEIAENLWAINLGGTVYYNDEYQEDYWTVNGGKWGIINAQHQEIVPVRYDVLMTNWYRVKDLLIVQNDVKTFDHTKPFDAYDLNGNQLDSGKINYREHLFDNG